MKRPKTSEQVSVLPMLLLNLAIHVVLASVLLVQSFADAAQTCLIIRCFLQLCKQCFYAALEGEVHDTIVKHNLFKPGERIAVAASGMCTAFSNFACLLRMLISNRKAVEGLWLFKLNDSKGHAPQPLLVGL